VVCEADWEALLGLLLQVLLCQLLLQGHHASRPCTCSSRRKGMAMRVRMCCEGAALLWSCIIQLHDVLH
jgi:hypothetical protein